jgi:hypothetical protein
MRKILEQCPTCGGPLTITELTCDRCQTQVRSRYAPCAFCALTAEQLVFARLFIENRGNLKDMEKALGVSYPTVRNKLEEIAARLAGAPAPRESVSQTAPVQDAGVEERRAILQQIAEGKLSPKEALARLRGEGGATG